MIIFQSGLKAPIMACSRASMPPGSLPGLIIRESEFTNIPFAQTNEALSCLHDFSRNPGFAAGLPRESFGISLTLTFS